MRASAYTKSEDAVMRQARRYSKAHRECGGVVQPVLMTSGWVPFICNRCGAMGGSAFPAIYAGKDAKIIARIKKQGARRLGASEGRDATARHFAPRVRSAAVSS